MIIIDFTLQQNCGRLVFGKGPFVTLRSMVVMPTPRGVLPVQNHWGRLVWSMVGHSRRKFPLPTNKNEVSRK